MQVIKTQRLCSLGICKPDGDQIIVYSFLWHLQEILQKIQEIFID